MNDWTPLQVKYEHEPWKLLVACILLNCVRGERVQSVLDQLFDEYPGPESMIKADPEELAEILHPLGFQNRRARILIKFSNQWIEKPHWRKYTQDLGRYCGVGAYATEAWRVIILRDHRFPAEDWAMEKWRQSQC